MKHLSNTKTLVFKDAPNWASLVAIFAVSVCFSGQAAALQSDGQQPINLSADRAELDDHRGISTYTGNVELTQGSLLLSGDKLIIESQDGETEMVTTFGKPGRFKQRPDDKPDDVVATARRIKYDPKKNRITLDGDALVVQGRQRFSGEHITYDMATDKVKASSGEGGESGGRVHMTLPGRQN